MRDSRRGGGRLPASSSAADHDGSWLQNWRLLPDVADRSKSKPAACHQTQEISVLCLAGPAGREAWSPCVLRGDGTAESAGSRYESEEYRKRLHAGGRDRASAYNRELDLRHGGQDAMRWPR